MFEISSRSPVFSWFFDILAYLGLWQKNAKILFLGLDNAGKTTLMHMLRDNRLAVHTPTQITTSEEVVVGNTRIRAFDLGGHRAARTIWRNYYANVNGVVFLVDAVDRSRFPEVKEEIDSVMADEQLANVPILVLGNKIDVPAAASEDELLVQLGLFHKTTGKEARIGNDSRRPIELFMASVARRMGYSQGFEWLCDRIP